jgi:hypothetical protein
MTYRCAACHRRLLMPTFTGPGGYMLGPKCAKNAGKTELKRRRKAKVVLALAVEVQAGQMALELVGGA